MPDSLTHSIKFSGDLVMTFMRVFLPIPYIAEAVSHHVKACASESMLHSTPSELSKISCTGMQRRLSCVAVTIPVCIQSCEVLGNHLKSNHKGTVTNIACFRKLPGIVFMLELDAHHEHCIFFVGIISNSSSTFSRFY